ncbi:hypothetical protein M3O75_18025 [Klebsiella pneumoniae]|nr:hypothetical protein [Klebsiella pneumoniae]
MTALMNRIGVDSERPLKSLLELVGMNEQKLKSYSESQLHRALSKELEANMPDIDPKTLARWLKDEGHGKFPAKLGFLFEIRIFDVEIPTSCNR